MNELITTLSSIAGASGYEQHVADAITQWIKPYVDDVFTDSVGNLYAVKRGAHKENADNEHGGIMLLAHMDELGLTVVDVDEDGLLRVEPMGKLKAADLVGARVEFARTGLIGVVGAEDPQGIDLDFRHLYVDMGRKDKLSVLEQVQIGDAASLSYSVQSIGENRIIGHALDGRAACAVVMETMRRERSEQRIVAVFTAQHEVGSRGAQVAAYRVQPDLAVAVDLTHAGDTPKSGKSAVCLGKGPAIKALDSHMVVSPELMHRLMDVAVQAQIPYQVEVSSRAHSEAGTAFISRAGVPTCGISLAARYLDTPSQMVDLQDVEYAVQLLTEFLQRASVPSFV